jgi:hypothetical protein
VRAAEAKVQLISPFVGRIYDWFKAANKRDYSGAEARIWLDVVPMCILTPKTLNICGLILSFIGAVMLFIRFLAHLIRASGRPIWQSWFVRWCGGLGIALITIGFLLQLVAKFSQ